jgi:hypothetical protein
MSAPSDSLVFSSRSDEASTEIASWCGAGRAWPPEIAGRNGCLGLRRKVKSQKLHKNVRLHASSYLIRVGLDIWVFLERKAILL